MEREVPIGALIKYHRIRAANGVPISIAELARRAGRPGYSHLGEIESGKRLLPPELLKQLIAALKLSERDAEVMRVANLKARANAEGLELAERRTENGNPGEAEMWERESPQGVIRFVEMPFIDETFTGNPEEAVMDTEGPGVMGRISMPFSAAMLEEQEGCLALLMTGDEMAPRAAHGAIVTFSTNKKAVQGKAAVVGLKDRTVCRIWRESKGTVTLEPLNPDYQPIILPKSAIKWHRLVITVTGAW